MARGRGGLRRPGRARRSRSAGREIGHLHGDHAAHFVFPKQVWAELEAAGADRAAPGVPRQAQGPASRAIRSEDDVRDVIALLAPELRPDREPGSRPPERRRERRRGPRGARRDRHRRLARARARARPQRWPSGAGGWSSTPAAPTTSSAPPRALPGVTAFAGDVADDRAPPGARRGRPAGRHRPARQQRERARPEPAAGARRLTRSPSSRASTRSNVLAPLALVQLALPLLRRGRRDRQRHLRCRPSSRTRAGAATGRRRPRSSS